jgi:hypothetical protein
MPVLCLRTCSVFAQSILYHLIRNIGFLQLLGDNERENEYNHVFPLPSLSSKIEGINSNFFL